MSWSTAETEIYNNALANVEQTNKQLARVYLKVQKEISDKLKQFYNSVDPSWSAEYQAKRLSDLFKEINKRLTLLTKIETRKIEEAFLDQYKTTFETYSYNMGEYLGILPLSIPSESLIMAGLNEKIGEYSFLKSMSEKQALLREQLQDAVGISISKGEGPVKLLARLKETFDSGISRYMATARSELLRAYSIAQDESISQAIEQGIEFDYIWRANIDGRTRESHVLENGKKAKIDKKGMPIFKVGRSTGTGPRLLYGPDQAKQTIQCRCRRINSPVI